MLGCRSKDHREEGKFFFWVASTNREKAGICLFACLFACLFVSFFFFFPFFLTFFLSFFLFFFLFFSFFLSFFLCQWGIGVYAYSLTSLCVHSLLTYFIALVKKTVLFPFLFRFTLYAEGHISVGISDKRYTSINSDFNSGIYHSYFTNLDLWVFLPLKILGPHSCGLFFLFFLVSPILEDFLAAIFFHPKKLFSDGKRIL